MTFREEVGVADIGNSTVELSLRCESHLEQQIRVYNLHELTPLTRKIKRKAMPE